MEKVFLIKLSGEAMSGKYGSGLDFDYIEELFKNIQYLEEKKRFLLFVLFVYYIYYIIN